MYTNKLLILYIFIALAVAELCCGRQAYFADGYHGGIYGHYPKWQTQFMVDQLNANPDWKINLEIEPETWDEVFERDPDSLNQLNMFCTDLNSVNRVEFTNPSYAQPYCYNISGESIIRQFIYGMEKTRKYFPDAQFTTYACEEPCFTSCLPQLLTSLGFKYAVLRNPDTCWGGYTSAFGRDLVNWHASDGSSILTVPRYACEGLVSGSTWQTESWNNSEKFIRSCFDDGIKYPVGMCYQDAGWRHGPWLGNIIRRFYEPSEYILWTDYIEIISPKVIPDKWDFTIEDVKPGLVWGAQILQKLAREIRVTENRIIMAEKIAAFSSIFNSTPYPETKFDLAWRNLMLAQHHDCWIVPYNGRPGGNWATNVTEWTGESNHIADIVIADACRSISGSNSDSKYITVFNSLGCPRRAKAALNLPDTIKATEYQVQDLNGEPVPSQIISNGDGIQSLIFNASAPAMGYSTYMLVKKPSRASKSADIKTLNNNSLQISTDFYEAIINPEKGGSITSLIAKKLNHNQLVETGKSLNSLHGFFYDQQKFISTIENKAKVSIVENGPVLVRIKIETDISGNPLTQYITFYQNDPFIDFDLKIAWQSSPGIGAYSQKDNYVKEDPRKAFYNDKYKLQVTFPVKGVGSRVFKNAPFDVCESKLENTYYDSWDTIKHNVILNWVDVTDKSGNLGVSLFTDHTTSYINSGEVPLGLTVQYIGRALWGRNYRVNGPTEIKYALLPHINLWDQAGVHTKSISWNEPLFVSLSTFKPDKPSYSLLEVQTKGVELTSVTRDQGHLYFRLFNAEADSENIVVNLHSMSGKIQVVDLNNNLIKELIPDKINDQASRFSLSIPRFGVRTIRLQ